MINTNNDKAQPLVAHLLELRSRLLRIIVVLLVIFIVLVSFANDIYTFVAQPLLDALPEGSKMIATEVTSTFMAPIRLVMVLSLFLAIPYILFEIWRFIAPGLFDQEKRLAFPLLVSSVALFYSGVAFAYYAVFPIMFFFFSSNGPEGVIYTPDISKFLDTILTMFFAFGVVFEIPIATFILIYTGITSVESMVNKRPYVIVSCFAVAMFLTPPDPISQTIMAIPMCLLFECGLFFARFIKKPAGDTKPDNSEDNSENNSTESN